MTKTNSTENAKEKYCQACKKVYVGEATACEDCGAELLVKDPLIGTVFADKYEIQSILGQGGMSIVYKARHKYMNRIVAVKLLLEHLAEDKIAFERFKKEAEAASSLSHQNIVNVHDFGVSGTQAYFVMDCLEGESLQDIVLRDNGVPVARAVDIFRQTCDGLAHAHKKGVVHRDLKPSNIVLVKEEDGSDTVKIVDFGLAKLHRPEGPEELRLTQSGMVFGSPMYMSPEQCQGYPLDARSDIYSMGVLMYETLAGVPPFTSDSFFNIALLHIHQSPPKFSETAPSKHIPAEMESVILQCMEKDKDKRFQTVEELRQKVLDSALVGGVPGLVQGAVPVKDSGKQSPLRKTLENMQAVFSGPHTEKQKASPQRIALIAALGAFAVIGTAYFFLYPGIESDGITPYQAIRWKTEVDMGIGAIKSGDFQKADWLLKDAKNFAEQFSDNHRRMQLTVDRQADLYAAWSKFPELERANKESAELLTEQVLAEANGVKNAFIGLGAPTDSEAEKQADRLHATADVVNMERAAKRLHSRNLFRQEENLMNVGIDALRRLGLGDSAQTAELQALKAEALLVQQRMDEVRPILVSARDILKKNASDGSQMSMRHYLKAELRLGQFDRDQSNFKEAEEELKLAMNVADKEFKEDKNLRAECMNSYSDLMRQLGRKEEAATYALKAKQLHATGVEPE